MLVAVILFEQPARRFLGAPLGTLTPYTVTGTNDNFVTITNNQKLTQIKFVSIKNLHNNIKV